MSCIGVVIAWDTEANGSRSAHVGNYRLSVMGSDGFSWYVDHLFPYQGGEGLEQYAWGRDFITSADAEAAAEAALVRVLHSPRKEPHP